MAVNSISYKDLTERYFTTEQGDFYAWMNELREKISPENKFTYKNVLKYIETPKTAQAIRAKFGKSHNTILQFMCENKIKGFFKNGLFIYQSGVENEKI